MPLEFARPSGNRVDFESSSRRGVSDAFADRITILARCRISRFWASKYTTPVTRPELSVETSFTYAFARISQLPVFSASGSIVTAELDRALTWHPNPEHIPQFTHA